MIQELNQLVEFGNKVKKYFEQSDKEEEILFNELMLKVQLGITDRVRIIEGYENYAITEKGDIYNIKTKRKKKQQQNEHGYYYTQVLKNGERKTQTIHRLLGLAFVDNPENLPCVDHKDRNRQNNNLNNLHWVSHSENGRNKTKKANTTSKYVGVSFHKQAKKWNSLICVEGKLKYIGLFLTEEEAAKAYDKFARENNLKGTNYNFPE